MKYPCLVVDHDDTVVDSTSTIHYPCFMEYVGKFFPHYSGCTREEYFIKNFDPGIVALFRDEVGLSAEQMLHEQEYWNAYVQKHVPPAYPGMREVLLEQVRRGGRLFVISHSMKDNILRDYRENDLPEPERVYGWEYPAGKRKPRPDALFEIMRDYGYAPDEMLVLDDLKPGYDMARAGGVGFAAAGWANDIPVIEDFMRTHCDLYFKTIPELRRHLFE